jgi:hypothetical protein
MFNKCKWIWDNQPDGHKDNQWLNIRKVFDLDQIDGNAKLHLSVDTDYLRLVNT